MKTLAVLLTALLFTCELVPPTAVPALTNEQAAALMPQGASYCYTDEETGFLLYEESSRFGLLNQQGDIVLPPTYVQPFYFSSGLAAVRRPEGFAYLWPDGTELISGLDDAYPFEGEYAIAIYREHYGLLDKTGAWVLPPEYDELDAPEGGTCRAVKDEKELLLDIPGWQEAEK